MARPPTSDAAGGKRGYGPHASALLSKPPTPRVSVSAPACNPPRRLQPVKRTKKLSKLKLREWRTKESPYMFPKSKCQACRVIQGGKDDPVVTETGLLGAFAAIRGLALMRDAVSGGDGGVAYHI